MLVVHFLVAENLEILMELKFDFRFPDTAL